VGYISRELPAGVESAFIEATSYVAQVSSGEVAIRTDAAPVVPPAPSPIERRSLTVLQASRWCDVDGTRTAGKLTEADLPIAIAERALQFGFAAETNSDVVRRLLETTGRDYTFQREADCVDITRPPAPLAAPEVRATESVQHSEFVPPGRAMVGGARAVPRY
jgi:hypothetical protein